MVGVLLVARRAVEEDARVNLLQVDLDPDLLEGLLDHLLGLLADGVDGGGVGDLQLHAVLRPHVAVHRPARVVEDLLGLVQVELVGGVRRIKGRQAVEHVRSCRLALAVELLCDGVPVGRQVHRLPDCLVAQERVGLLEVGALPLHLRVRVGEVDVDPL